ncbi:DegT/DnrJ/EryC1/StrS family aminotransferase [Kitasatospora purpeofusca]|uniref:DegT/DnrJ/EryC1/StrS family aminotransferase n=1 Tax=Kitasatospora purpeofusca TaxID=67352 RepID=UPI00324C079F
MTTRNTAGASAGVESAPSWPVWPQASASSLALLEEVLHSGRWAISGRYRGRPSFERRFAAAFARYVGTTHCVPTASGTASLMTALEACGVGAGDEVVIPGLTWVANASAVAAMNAVPVPVDVREDTYTMDPDAVRSAIGPRTTAIVAVHLYSSLADLRALQDLADRHGLVLIEDAAQAHGARYLDRAAGSHGHAGTFSMQTSKLLTSGEGGAVTTDRADVARAVEHLRADGRAYADAPTAVGAMELVESAEIMGSNRCLSEFQAAVLLDQLTRLDEQNATRLHNAARLDDRLKQLGLKPQETAVGTTLRTYYSYVVTLEEGLAADLDLDAVGAELTRRLGTPVGRCHRPLDINPLYRPSSRARFRRAGPEILEGLAAYELPIANSIHRRALMLEHAALLGTHDHMDAVADAFAAVLDTAPRS